VLAGNNVRHAFRLACGMTFAEPFATTFSGATMEKHNDQGLQANQKTHGIWERRTGDRRLGQNQLFGSFRINPGARVLSQSDPTDQALAAIASILHPPAEAPILPADTSTEKATEPATVSAPVGDLDTPETPNADEAAVASIPAPSAAAGHPDTYVKYGPGPLNAIRLKWSIRPADGGNYFVDETIGDSSRAVTSAPMPKDEAIRFVDERERDARRRFDALKNEMTGQAAAPHPVRDGSLET
jgi:hypothetical protein